MTYGKENLIISQELQLQPINSCLEYTCLYDQNQCNVRETLIDKIPMTNFHTCELRQWIGIHLRRKRRASFKWRFTNKNK